MGNADAARLELGVRHRTRAWQNIDIDLGPGGQGRADFVEPVIPRPRRDEPARPLAGSVH